MSHYCEKARWAFCRAHVPFHEEAHLPFFSRLAGLRHGAWTSVPLLVTDEGIVRDSTAILRWIDARTDPSRRLYPDDAALRGEVESWEDFVDLTLGPHTRRLGYSHVLPDKALVLRIAASGAPAIERWAVTAFYPAVRRTMERGLQINEAGVARSRVKIASVFDRVAARLAEGRRFLVGERFSAADLAFAALAAPIVAAPEYGGPLPSLDDLPPAGRAEIQGYRDTPAGRFALRLYREERGG